MRQTEPTTDDRIRPYGPGKFSLVIDELVYSASLDGGPDEECGDSTESGWYGLITGPMVDALGLSFRPGAPQENVRLTDAEHAFLSAQAGCILFESTNGFVEVDYFEDTAELESAWAEIQAAHDDSETDDDDDDDDRRRLAIALDTANHWSSDQTGKGLALLSLGTTRTIHSETHRAETLCDIERDIAWNRQWTGPPDGVNEPARDIPLLEDLADLVRHATIGRQWLTYEEYFAISEALYQDSQDS